MKENQGRKEVQKGTKNAITKGKNHCRKKEKSMKARKEQKS